MGVFDNIKKPSASVPDVQPEVQATPGIFANVKKPVSTPPATSTPASKGIFANVKRPVSAPKTETPTPSPYFYKKNPDGSTIGHSPELDTSGKPFLDYRKPGDEATTTDKTRVATTFDPQVPAPQTRETFTNARAAGLRDKMKKEMGIAYSDELDHKIALALSGSNQKENLRAIPAEDNNDSPIITKLQDEVVSGKKSLFQAQVELAEAKGLPVPWTTKTKVPGFMDKLKGVIHKAAGSVEKAVVGVGDLLTGAYETQNDTPKQPTKDTGVPFVRPDQAPQNAEIKVPEGLKAGDSFKGSDGKTYVIQAPTISDIGKAMYEGLNPDQGLRAIPKDSVSSTPQKAGPTLTEAGVKLKQDLTNPSILADAVKEFPQSFADIVGKPQLRAYAAVGSYIAKRIGVSDQDFKPEGQFLTSLYGTDKPLTLSGVGAENRPFGPKDSSGKFKYFDPAFGFIIGSLDTMDGGGLGKLSRVFKLSRSAEEIIAASKSAEEIATTLRREIPELSEGLAKVMAQPLIHIEEVKDVNAVLNKTRFQLQELSKAAENAAQESKGLQEGKLALDKAKTDVASVEDLHKLTTNNLQKNNAGIREKSIQYYKDNPQEITKSPVKIREADGQLFIEDGRHRLEAARQVGIDNLKIEDVTPLYPEVEGQAGKSSEILRSILKDAPEDRSIRVKGKFAGSRAKATHDAADIMKADESLSLPKKDSSIRYHGTSRNIDNFSKTDDMYSEQNIYGQGFYTTDNKVIAEGYTKKGNGGNPRIYEISEKSDVPIYNIENPMSKDLLGKINKLPIAEFQPYKEGQTMREVYDDIREMSASGEFSVHEAQEQMDALRVNIENEGYRGIEHVGGKLTGNEPHSVKIYWNPDQDLTLSKTKSSEEIPHTDEKIDYKTAEKGNKEIDKELRKEAPKPKLTSQQKEVKSIDRFLNTQANKTNIDIVKRDRLDSIKKSIGEADARVKMESKVKQQYQDRVNRAKIETTKSGGILGTLKGKLYPSKVLDPKSKMVVEKWFTKTVEAKQLAMEDFNWALKQGPQNFQEIMDFQAGSNTSYIRNYFDDLGTEFHRRGLEFGWKDNYVPDVWKDSPKRQAQARAAMLKKKGMSDQEIADYLGGLPLDEGKALRLKLRPNFVKERFWPDYKTGMAHGLTPKYEIPADLMGYYREAGERAIANKELIEELKQQARLLPTDEAPDTWVPVTTRFTKREALSAPPALANLLNNKFIDENNLTLGQKLFKVGAGTSKFVQDLVLSGGFPGTNINGFTAAQAYRVAATFVGNTTSLQFRNALTDLKTGFAFIRSNSNKVSRAWFQSKMDIIGAMARNGIDVADNVAGKDYKRLFTGMRDALSTEKGLIKKTGGIFKASKFLFDKAMSEKTFKSLLPQMKVTVFEGAYKQALRKGLSPEMAEEVAAEVTKASEGIIAETGRSNKTKDELSTIFFAPSYREGLVNIFTNAAKGFTTDIRNPKYARNRSFIIGLAVTYLLYNLLNEKLNGNYLWDNPPGRELALRIPFKNGDIGYFELGPGLLTVPRNLFLGTSALVRGDTDTAKQKYGSLLSMPLSIISQIWANKDYFGNPIWAESDGKDTKIKKMATHVGLSVNHPYVAQLYKYAAGKQPFYWSVVNMLEFPLKLTSLDRESKSKFYENLNKQKKVQAEERAKIMPIYKANQDLKNSGQVEEADRIYNELSDGDKAVYDTIKRSEKIKDTKNRQAALQQFYDNLQKLKEEGQLEEAEAQYYSLSPEDQHAYDLLKKKMQN